MTERTFPLRFAWTRPAEGVEVARPGERLNRRGVVLREGTPVLVATAYDTKGAQLVPFEPDWSALGRLQRALEAFRLDDEGALAGFASRYGFIGGELAFAYTGDRPKGVPGAGLIGGMERIDAVQVAVAELQAALRLALALHEGASVEEFIVESERERERKHYHLRLDVPPGWRTSVAASERHQLHYSPRRGCGVLSADRLRAQSARKAAHAWLGHLREQRASEWARITTDSEGALRVTITSPIGAAWLGLDEGLRLGDTPERCAAPGCERLFMPNLREKRTRKARRESPGTVTGPHYCDRNACARPTQRRKKRANELDAEGASAVAIAKQLDVPVRSVRAWLEGE